MLRELGWPLRVAAPVAGPQLEAGSGRQMRGPRPTLSTKPEQLDPYSMLGMKWGNSTASSTRTAPLRGKWLLPGWGAGAVRGKYGMTT